MQQLFVLAISAFILAGCTSVVNTFKSEPFEPDPTKKGIISSLNDKKMSTYIGVNLKKAAPELNDSHINVTTVNSVVLLAGEVPSNEMKLLSGKVARDFTGVRKVHNELQIRGNTSLVSRTNDKILAAQIKTKLVFEEQVSSSQITVLAEDGIVFLMGITTKANGDLAANIASSNSGVRKVVKVFEYVD
ncbi:MAG: BON domain-containing protein [Porticoccaceae bacterium]|nr:BON domain-containing protein [Porticoccaceae bacterium]